MPCWFHGRLLAGGGRSVVLVNTIAGSDRGGGAHISFIAVHSGLGCSLSSPGLGSGRHTTLGFITCDQNAVKS